MPSLRLRRPHLVVAARALLRSARHEPQRTGPRLAPTAPPALGCVFAGVTPLRSARAAKNWLVPCYDYAARPNSVTAWRALLRSARHRPERTGPCRRSSAPPALAKQSDNLRPQALHSSPPGEQNAPPPCIVVLGASAAQVALRGRAPPCTAAMYIIAHCTAIVTTVSLGPTFRIHSDQ